MIAEIQLQIYVYMEKPASWRCQSFKKRHLQRISLFAFVFLALVLRLFAVIYL